MSDQGTAPDATTDGPDDELDTDGQAIKWDLVDEKNKSRLHQSWTPDEPSPAQRGADAQKRTESQKKPL